VLDGESTISIKSVDPATGQVSATIETSILAGGDIVSDGIGNHYLSSPQENSVYAITRNLQDAPYLYSEGHSAPTGLVYFSDDETLGLLSPVLNTLEIIPANATGVDRGIVFENDKIRLFPNPVEEILNISGYEGDFTLSLFSIQGELLRTLKNEKQVDISDLSAGLYVVSIQGTGLNVIRKVVKK